MTNKMYTSLNISKTKIVILLLNYFVGYMFLYPFLVTSLLSIDFIRTSFLYDVVKYSSYIITFFITLVCIGEFLYESYEQANFKKIAKDIFICFVIMWFASIVVNLFIMMISDTETSNNQSEVSNLVANLPLFGIFVTCIFAPLVEEGVLRIAIFQPLSKRFNVKFATIISSSIFGFLHVFNSLVMNDFGDVIHVLAYISMGVCICYAYYRSDNIYGAIGLHFVNNLLSVVILLLT